MGRFDKDGLSKANGNIMYYSLNSLGGRTEYASVKNKENWRPASYQG